VDSETQRTFAALMKEKGGIRLRASGYSMYPYIRPGDICRFERTGHPLRPGQIGLVVSDKGILYSHRLHRIGYQSGFVYQFRGDMNPAYDNPVRPYQVIGIMTELDRKGKILPEGQRSRRMWAVTAMRGVLFFRLCAFLFAWTLRLRPGHAPGGRNPHASVCQQSDSGR